MTDSETKGNGREDEDTRILRSHTAQLLEHFDTVQIFVTRHNGDEVGTTNASYGGGNYFTRYGQVKYWAIQQDEQGRLDLRRDNND